MIQIKNLCKNYGEQNIVQDANLLLPNKGLVCILGPSGCGKTTLLNILAGFDSKYQGEVVVDGLNLQQLSDSSLAVYRSRKIGFIFQDYHLFSSYTSKENVLMGSELNDYTPHENSERAEELLIKLGIGDKINQEVDKLSGGQKQRVAIARALLSDPSIILADEPTGALDRVNSTELMNLLKELSKTKLVIVITHDKKISEFADDIITIENHQIISSCNLDVEEQIIEEFIPNEIKQVSSFDKGKRNFKAHLRNYLIIALMMSIGIFLFMLSLSSRNIIENEIINFQDKNTVLNYGYIKLDNNTDEIENYLNEDDRINEIYKQYVINNVSLDYNNQIVMMEEKYPMSIANEKMSYGSMPKINSSEIALSPSLARQFNSDISKLIGTNIILNHDNVQYELVISGIFNASYDDFYISSDIEKDMYERLNLSDPYSIKYKVEEFKDIYTVSNDLKNKGLKAQDASDEVYAFLSTFENLNRLFIVVSTLLLIVSCLLSYVLLSKMQKSKVKEFGLLRALGFQKQSIQNIIIVESLLLSFMTICLILFLFIISYGLVVMFHWNIIIGPIQIISTVAIAFIASVLFSLISSRKLLHIEPGLALKS